MTILVADGFEDGNLSEYLGSTSGSMLVAGSGRNGGKAYSPGGVASSYIAFPVPASETLFTHVALSRGIRSGIFLVFRGGTAAVNVCIAVGSDGSVIAYRGTTTIIGQSVGGVVPAGYTSFQVKVVISDTVGSIEVRLNGSTTPVLNLTNVDTRDSTTAPTVNEVRLGVGAVSSMFGADVFLDDLVIWDTTGTVNNDWLGDLRVDSYMPNGDGDTVTMTPSTGTTHYTLVDEVPASATDYVIGDAAGEKDLFAMGNMSHTPTVVHAVIPVAHMLKTDAGLRETTLVVKSGGIEYDGPSIALSTTGVKYGRIVERNPNGDVAWTKSSVDAVQVGVKVTV